MTASDERRYIQAALEEKNFKPHYVHGDRIDVLADLDRMLWHMDEPFLAPNLYLHWELYRSAQQCGVEVMLDGLLGDSVVSHGDTYLTELAARGRWIASEPRDPPDGQEVGRRVEGASLRRAPLPVVAVRLGTATDGIAGLTLAHSYQAPVLADF